MMSATLRHLAMFFFHNKIRWLVVVMVVANIKYSITACPGDQVLPIAQSGSKQTRPRITGKYYKSILPTPKYIGKGRAIPSFLFHFSCLLFSAATTIAGHFFLLCHPQRGNGAPWPKTIYCVDWPPDTLIDGRCLSRGVVVTTRIHLAENIA